jgi:hypothetical protein
MCHAVDRSLSSCIGASQSVELLRNDFKASFRSDGKPRRSYTDQISIYVESSWFGTEQSRATSRDTDRTTHVTATNVIQNSSISTASTILFAHGRLPRVHDPLYVQTGLNSDLNPPMYSEPVRNHVVSR